jgi:hypothetical protein
MLYLALGVTFGFILSRIGATDYDAVRSMFTLEDLHLMGVIGVAVAVAAVGFAVLRRRGIACQDGCRVTLAPKPVKPGIVLGSLVFGAGWALTGTCPGTGLAQIGEGKLVALFTVLGIAVGAALHIAVGPTLEERLSAIQRSRRSRRPPPPPEAASEVQAS